MGEYYTKYKLSKYTGALLFSSIFFLWLLICGGQYNVGTDYFSYMSNFNGERNYHFRNGEFLFSFIIRICNYVGLKGQSLFFVFYAIGFFFFFLILKRLQIRYMYLYIILYITVSNLFNNQLNILRQILALYIGTYSIILYFENKKLSSIILILIASRIHFSALVFFAIYFIRLFYTEKQRGYYILLAVSIAFGLLFKIEWLNILLNIKFLPWGYLNYISSGGIEYRDIYRVLTKYIFIPFYLLGIISLIGKNKLTKQESMLFFIGFISFCLRIATVNLDLFSRIAESFLLLSIFPIYFYFREILKKKQWFWFSLIIWSLFLFYFLKTIILSTPGREYFYRSIYF
jgi:hypothetical protein